MKNLKSNSLLPAVILRLAFYASRRICLGRYRLNQILHFIHSYAVENSVQNDGLSNLRWRELTGKKNYLSFFASLRMICILAFPLFLIACGPKEIVPVELFPEDECASCRMAVSSPEFASEIINVDGTVVKFDDLRCFENYRKTHTPDEFAAIFVMNYDTKQWMPFGKSIVIQTSIETPMGSGQVAVADQQRANQLKEQYPSTVAAMDGDACCAPKK